MRATQNDVEWVPGYSLKQREKLLPKEKTQVFKKRLDDHLSDKKRSMHQVTELPTVPLSSTSGTVEQGRELWDVYGSMT